MDRRGFLKALTSSFLISPLGLNLSATPIKKPRPKYQGKKLILIRFGGGTRREETLSDPAKSFAPFFLKELAPRGVLFENMVLSGARETSHGQGTLHLLTGRYNAFVNHSTRPFQENFEPTLPTLFELLRSEFDIPEHQAVMINGEDRIGEEFYTSSLHENYGLPFRGNILSLFRFKTWLLRQNITDFKDKEGGADQFKKKLLEMEKSLPGKQVNYPQNSEISSFWKSWFDSYGSTGLVNPRGDRLITSLAVKALEKIQPKLMMINYNDCDYVHWGNPTHYTRGISIMDQGLRTLVNATQAHPEYRNQTQFVVVPDCGRDNNPFIPVPFQHHFNSGHARKIFALIFGAGINPQKPVKREVEQVQVVSTIAGLMGFKSHFSEGTPLTEVFD